MDIIGLEWKVSDRGVERLGVDVIVIKADGTRETKNVRLDGNGTSSAHWGLIESIAGVNKVLGYEEKFWERPGFGEVPKRKK